MHDSYKLMGVNSCSFKLTQLRTNKRFKQNLKSHYTYTNINFNNLNKIKMICIKYINRQFMVYQNMSKIFKFYYQILILKRMDKMTKVQINITICS